MNAAVYQPFKNFDFKNQLCFLSGEKPVAQTSVLADWLIEMANLTGEEQIKLLDESIRSYKSLTVPANAQIYAEFILSLEDKIEAAFKKGYAGLKELEEVDLFNWIGKLMYSFLYIEMQGAIRINQLSGDGMNMSQGLMHKFGNLHTMLQSIHRSVVFEEFTPWSIVIVPLSDANTAFSFRDEINTLTFSLGTT